MAHLVAKHNLGPVRVDPLVLVGFADGKRRRRFGRGPLRNGRILDGPPGLLCRGGGYWNDTANFLNLTLSRSYPRAEPVSQLFEGKYFGLQASKFPVDLGAFRQISLKFFRQQVGGEAHSRTYLRICESMNSGTAVSGITSMPSIPNTE